MYFSRVRVSPNHLAEFAYHFQHTYYRQHQLLWKLFRDKPDDKRDFLFRQDTDRQGLPVFYMLSEHEPSHSVNLFLVETKPFNPQLKTGDTLAFSLRANPVEQITQERTTEEKIQLRIQRKEKGLKDKEILPHKRIRHDVVMSLKNSLLEKGIAKNKLPSQAELEQQAGEQWLTQRAEKNGFEVSSVIAQGYQQHRFKKRQIKISTLDFEGLLEITEPELFKTALFKGIGSAKAFGCGMLLIKRA
jgi:CRISPR system Cascade subunit CasE